MIGSIVNRILHRYGSTNYIVKKRAQFLLSLITIAFILTPLLILYYSYLHIINPVYNHQIQLKLIIPSIGALALTLLTLVILVKGYFSTAGNLLIITWQTALWVIMFISSEEQIVRLDTTVMIAASLTVIPGIIIKKRNVIILYTLINITIFLVFMVIFRESLNLSSTSYIDFISINTIAFFLIGLISYIIFIVNSNALAKAENEIQERKRSEVQKNRLQTQLLQSQKLESVGLLAGGIAHDFNNILTAVHGFAEIAAQEVDENSRARKEIDEVIKASTKAKELIQQLLAFAKIQPIDMKRIDLNRVINDFSEMLSRTIRNNIRIHKNLCEDPGTIEGDPVQIEQIMLNLALNSQDAMQDGGAIIIETTRIVVESDICITHGEIVPGEYILMTIADTGTGIDPELIDNIFNPFFTTKEFGRGTGLGLSTVYGIVKQHRGLIHVYSEIGNGTIFKIYFPVEDGRDTHRIKTESVHKDQRGDETILAVEDNPEVRKFIETVLNRQGYNVLIAGNAESALALNESYKKRIHLLVTDVLIPDMNGIQLYKTVKTTRPDIKVIFISGYTSNMVMQDDISVNNFNFIQKPFSVKNLTGKIRETLES